MTWRGRYIAEIQLKIGTRTNYEATPIYATSFCVEILLVQSFFVELEG
jgi:hypothetical protein